MKSKLTRTHFIGCQRKPGLRIYTEYSQLLKGEAHELYKEDYNFPVSIDEILYLLTSNTIDLCSTLFPRQNSEGTGRLLKCIPNWI